MFCLGETQDRKTFSIEILLTHLEDFVYDINLMLFAKLDFSLLTVLSSITHHHHLSLSFLFLFVFI